MYYFNNYDNNTTQKSVIMHPSVIHLIKMEIRLDSYT